MASNIQAGDRVSITVKSRVPGYAAGETGMVIRLTRRPQTGELTTYVVRMDRDGAIVAFYPGEVDRA